MRASILLLLLIALCVALVAAGHHALDRRATDSPVWGFLKVANRTYCQMRWGPTWTDRQWVRLPPEERATLVDSVVETLAFEEPEPGPSEQMVVVFDWDYPSSAQHGRHVIGSQFAWLRYLREGLIPEYVRVQRPVALDPVRLRVELQDCVQTLPVRRARCDSHEPTAAVTCTRWFGRWDCRATPS